MKFLPSLSRAGVSLGLILAVSSVVATGTGAFLVWRMLEKENQASVEQSIGDTTSLLSNYFRAEFEHIINILSETEGNQIKPILLSPNGPDANPSVQMEPTILDISVWKRGQPVSVFDLYPEPVRVILAVNSRYPGNPLEIAKEVQAIESNEKPLIQPAFQGHVVVLFSSTTLARKKTFLVAAPLKQADTDEVVVAHISVEQLQAPFRKEGMVTAALLDDLGHVLGHSDRQQVGSKDASLDANFRPAMKVSQLQSGQIRLVDSAGARYFGGFSRVGVGQLTVIAKISEIEATNTIKMIQRQALVYLAACFLFFLGAGYLVSTRRKKDLQAQASERSSPGVGTHEPSPEELPKRLQVTVAYGSIRQMSRLMETEDPAAFADLVNDYFTVACSLVEEYGGIFERHGELSFLGVWGAPTSDGTEVWRAIRCSLELRKELSRLNGLRKVDGLKPLISNVGVHTGAGLGAKIGPIKNQKYTVIGEVVLCGRALSQFGQTAKIDLLVSQAAWQQSEGKFTGDLVGEAKLTSDTGLTSYFSITGYRNELGEVVPLEMERYPEQKSPVDPERNTSDIVVSLQSKKPTHWLVNNGSQIIGPLTEKEIASRLFAQELDFDCECWAEGTGTSAQLRTAGIFSGSEDARANLWVFDGETVHGPMLEGFLQTALVHGAISKEVYVCEGSTVLGWKKLATWNPALSFPTDPHSDSNSSADPGQLQASLAPPKILNRRTTRKTGSAGAARPKKAA